MEEIQLTDEQLRAVTAPPSIVQVVAGPGTGKTRCVTARAIYLLSMSKHSRILVLSHTRKAVSEIAKRVSRRISDLSRVKIMTLHGFCMKTARILGVFNKNARLLKDKEKKEFLKKCLEIHPVFQEIDTIEDTIENCKNLLITPEEAYCLLPEDLAKIYEIYEREKEKENLFDFEDMLVSVYRKLSSNHKLADTLRQQFQHVIVDEAHDMNKAQYEIVRLIQNGSFFAVLDPNQRIYAFRAGGGPLHRIRQDYPDSKEFRLTVNFRSGRRIVEATNRLMNTDIKPRPNAPEGKIEILIQTTWEKQAKEIARKIIEITKDYPNETVAVLVRTNFQAATIAPVLEDYGIKSNINVGRNVAIPSKSGQCFLHKRLWEKALSVLKKLSSPPEPKGNGKIKVTISTIHKAKGKEWDHVVIPDVVDKLPCCKQEREEEEKRIFYVATTRPRKTLVLSAAKECYGQNTNPSRYIVAIPSNRVNVSYEKQQYK